MSWQPGRIAHRNALEEPYRGVPDHLWTNLGGWLENHLNDPAIHNAVGMQLRLPLLSTPKEAVEQILYAGTEKDDVALDTVELILGLLEDDRDREALRQMLRFSNSLYELRPDGKGLQQRILPGVQEAMQATIELAGTSRAGESLTNAWNACYGANTSPLTSYSESVRAVEYAAIPMVEPKNSRATLGTSLGILRDTRAGWIFAIAGKSSDGVDTVIDMLALLWHGHVQRHGGNSSEVQTPESAQAALHLAGTLCQWFLSGAVRRRT